MIRSFDIDVSRTLLPLFIEDIYANYRDYHLFPIPLSGYDSIYQSISASALCLTYTSQFVDCFSKSVTSIHFFPYTFKSWLLKPQAEAKLNINAQLTVPVYVSSSTSFCLLEGT
ncbi:hypothetical protein AVDCRST_MAG81-1616 [uncultured Synechococcales cyanobacterium]|uniref:Uncharacterized protein n=1 Tax=uncultured Synechococcales cyanobacterium TaxID=1936017 RepID=A0A6J4V9T9_9CYAN|nr:hypothetical protein AVDCRST_MAG81-1616 [uncultured Synechococcales cyanobacterium]